MTSYEICMNGAAEYVKSDCALALMQRPTRTTAAFDRVEVAIVWSIFFIAVVAVTIKSLRWPRAPKPFEHTVTRMKDLQREGLGGCHQPPSPPPRASSSGIDGTGWGYGN